MSEVYSQSQQGGRPNLVYGTLWFVNTYGLSRKVAQRIAFQHRDRWPNMSMLAKRVIINQVRRSA